MLNTKFKQTEIGEIPQDWKVAKLSDLLEIMGGGTPKTTEAEYWDGDIPWLSVVDFNDENRFVYKTEKTISEQGLKNSSTKILKKGQIIISARGTVGALAQLGRDMAFNQSCYGLSGKKISNDFLYYCIKNSINRIKQNVHGAVFDTITRETFDSILVSYPNSELEQEQIATILTSLDDKIKLNQKSIKNLEEIGQTLFKRWFVDFDFPNEKGEPYKANGGEMVDSELGEIPKGWNIVKLEKIINIRGGFSYKGEYLSSDIGLPLVNMGCASSTMRFNYNGIKYYTGSFPDKFKINPGDIVLPTRDVTQERKILGSPIVIPDDIGDEIICATNLYIVENISSTPNEYLYQLFRGNEFRERIVGSAKGTTILMLTKDSVLNHILTLPPKNLLSEYVDTVAPLIKNISTYIKQNRSLINLRNSLSPKLLSGKIRV
jgi:type I restriction enzyme S subunit